MSIPIEYQKRSVSMPQDLIAEVRARVGSREFSPYVARAVQHQLRRDALDDILTGMEAKYGPVNEASVAAIAASLES
ncbi:MAG: CopG family transcriptional regulator [Cellulomonadaceae bacterium]|jgi:Arc/MetJ-type ribon-helix-helix transcriptional regulator|nr:CopG family transcriptional regulator [Cellulomonadaceae bacterium]